MHKLLLSFLTFFIFSFTTIAQESSIQELETQKTELQETIKILKDSLQKVKFKISSLEKDDPVEEIQLGPNEILLRKKVALKESTISNSQILLELEAGTRVLKIDEIGNYYLLCFRGTCGYVKSIDLQSTTEKNAG